jgi:DNA-binding transcriptional MerR regulator
VARFRIGELSRRTGTSPEVLRAWETRHHLLRPERTSGGYRLYSEEDVRRVRAVQALRVGGVPLAEAARTVTAEERPATAVEGPAAEAAALAVALDAFDESAAQAAIDRLLARFSVGLVLRDVLLPHLRAVGLAWELGRRSIAQEHFASGMIEGRLRALARGWDQGSGPRAVLACPPGEQHTIGLQAFGLSLREHGRRIVWLGADAPLPEVDAVAGELEAELVVLSSVRAEVVAAAARPLAELAGRRRVMLGGEAARSPLVRELGCTPLREDPITAAASLAVPA